MDFVNTLGTQQIVAMSIQILDETAAFEGYVFGADQDFKYMSDSVTMISIANRKHHLVVSTYMLDKLRSVPIPDQPSSSAVHNITIGMDSICKLG